MNCCFFIKYKECDNFNDVEKKMYEDFLHYFIDLIIILLISKSYFKYRINKFG